jgi:hypothetical protein
MLPLAKSGGQQVELECLDKMLQPELFADAVARGIVDGHHDASPFHAARPVAYMFPRRKHLRQRSVIRSCKSFGRFTVGR